jgi:hypothetical protein
MIHALTLSRYLNSEAIDQASVLRWNFLYFFPLPHGQSSLRPIFRFRGLPLTNSTPNPLENELDASSSLRPFDAAGQQCRP